MTNTQFGFLKRAEQLNFSPEQALDLLKQAGKLSAVGSELENVAKSTARKVKKAPKVKTAPEATPHSEAAPHPESQQGGAEGGSVLSPTLVAALAGLGLGGAGLALSNKKKEPSVLEKLKNKINV